MDRRQQRESRLKGGCSQDWLAHNVSRYLLDTTLAWWVRPRQANLQPHPRRRLGLNLRSVPAGISLPIFSPANTT